MGALVFKTSGRLEESRQWVRFPYTPVTLHAAFRRELPGSFKVTPKLNTRPCWVRPELVCGISVTSWTGDNLLRHPVFMVLREDQDPATVRRQLAPTAT